MNSRGVNKANLKSGEFLPKLPVGEKSYAPFLLDISNKKTEFMLTSVHLDKISEQLNG